MNDESLAYKIFKLLGHCPDIHCKGWNSPNCGCQRRSIAAATVAMDALSVRAALGLEINDKTRAIRRSGFEPVITLSVLRFRIFEEIAKQVPEPIADDRLIALIWPNEVDRGEKPLDLIKAHVFYINGCIACLNLMVRKIRSFGYMLVDVPANAAATMSVQATADAIREATP